MQEQMLTITFTGKIKPVKPINKLFTLCRCYVMALGDNRNRNTISKEAADDALSSLFNIPVVGHLYRDEDGVLRMGGHDVKLLKDEDGTFKFIPLTVPYGVVPQQDNVHYEEVEEPNGEKNTYLVADIILWTGRYPELLEAIYDENVYFSQSMEVIPFETKKKNTGLDIKKYQYSALCLLGKSDDRSKNVKPCFASSKVEPYKFSDIGGLVELFSELKEQLAQSYSAADVGKGGKEALNTETIRKILIEFGLAEDTVLSFEVAEDMSEEELKAKIQEVYFSNQQPEGDVTESSTAESAVVQEENPEAPAGDDGEAEPAPVEQPESFSAAEPVTEEPVVEPVKFSVELTYEEKRTLLCKALDALRVHNENAYIWYDLVDFTEAFVYASYHFAGKDTAEQSGTIRIPYVISEDIPVLDIQHTEKVRLVWLTKSDEDKLSEEKAQLAELVQYKADRLEEDKRLAYSAVISEFSDLGEIEEYKTVVKEALAFESAEALREKMYAIRGKNADKVERKPIEAIRIPVGFQAKTKQSEYDEFMSRYLPAKK